MTLIETSPRLAERSGLRVAYAMTGLALGCIAISGVLGALFTPDMVTGYYHEHLPISALTGWIFDLIAVGMLVSAALAGIRARVTDPAPWTMLGLGVGAIWLAAMVVSIFAPLSVFGTDPEQIPLWSGLGAIAALVLTGILCNFVKVASFEPVASPPCSAVTALAPGLGLSADDAAAKLRRLTQLRDSGAISGADYQAKKSELLSRI